MSGSSFFGDPFGDLGPYNFYWDAPILTGDPGANTYLGGTKGTTIAISDTKTDITWDQGGTDPQNRILTGRSVMVNLALAQATLVRIRALLQGFEIYGTAGAEGFALSFSLGESDADVRKVLKAVKVIGGVDSTDPNDIMFFPLAAPMVEGAETAGDAETQRQFAGSFYCYRSEEYLTAVSGKPCSGFSKAAIDNGHVVVVP
jgi:hypothetical protein